MTTVNEAAFHDLVKTYGREDARDHAAAEGLPDTGPPADEVFENVLRIAFLRDTASEILKAIQKNAI